MTNVSIFTFIMSKNKFVSIWLLVTKQFCYSHLSLFYGKLEVEKIPQNGFFILWPPQDHYLNSYVHNWQSSSYLKRLCLLNKHILNLKNYLRKCLMMLCVFYFYNLSLLNKLFLFNFIKEKRFHHSIISVNLWLSSN